MYKKKLYFCRLIQLNKSTFIEKKRIPNRMGKYIKHIVLTLSHLTTTGGGRFRSLISDFLFYCQNLSIDDCLPSAFICQNQSTKLSIHNFNSHVSVKPHVLLESQVRVTLREMLYSFKSQLSSLAFRPSSLDFRPSSLAFTRNHCNENTIIYNNLIINQNYLLWN